MSRCLLLSLVLSLSVMEHAYAQSPEVDFEYAPAWWMTPIGFVDDWAKTMVLNDGALAYDFGPGPYAKPTTTISVGLVDIDLEHSQVLVAPKVPIIQTVSTSDGVSIQAEALALIPDLVLNMPLPERTDPGFRRLNGLTGSVAWATPGPDVDPVFRSVAWGTGRSIVYEIAVPPGSSHRVALGFAEAHRMGKIVREMEIRVEGAASRTVDLIREGEQNEPHAYLFQAEDRNADGILRVEVTASAGTQDPNTILNGIWLFDEQEEVTVSDIISGRGSQLAKLVVNCGWEFENQASQPRIDLMRATFDASGAAPVVSIRSRRSIASGEDGVFIGEGRPFIRIDPAPIAIEDRDGGFDVRFAPETDTVVVAVVHGLVEGSSFPEVPEFDRARSASVDLWSRLDLPWSTIQVPDHGIQDLIDASIRTIYQVRDVVDGYPQFQPGPSVYRGLWFGDGTWSVEGVALAGDLEAARLGIEAMMVHQDSTGRAGVMTPPLLHRETAHMIYGICRYARLSGDRDWLRSNWPVLEAAMQHLADLRKLALKDPDAPYYGLFPPGYTDGGIGGINPEYGSSYWGMIAMAEAVRIAAWMGNSQAEMDWSREFDSFLAAFRKAAERDMRRDEDGNIYVPVLMNFDPEKNVPQRGQWGMMHSYYAGQFVADDDSLLLGTLAMLDRNTTEGHVVSLGWLTGGVWPIFEAHRALVYNRLGDADKAIDLLYSFANHAAPTAVWVEEQMPKGEGPRTTGDVPHTIGNVQIIRLVRNMLVLEREGTLELLPSLPSSWLKNGSVVALNAAPTEFGPLDMKLLVSSDSASLVIDANGTPVQIRTRALADAGFTAANGGVLPPIIHATADGPTTLRFFRSN